MELIDGDPQVCHSQLVSYTTSTHDTLQETQATVAFVVYHADLLIVVIISMTSRPSSRK